MERQAEVITNAPHKKTARIAGVWYLAFIVGYILAQVIAKIGFGSAAEITDIMASNSFRFNAGFVIYLFSTVFFFLAAWYLYVLIKPVEKNIALLFLLLNLGGAVMVCFNSINLLAGMSVLREGQLQATALSTSSL